jgi:hypothetical protein
VPIDMLSFSSLQKPAISPLTCQPLGGHVRVFNETDTFRTIAIQSNTTALEITNLLLKSSGESHLVRLVSINIMKNVYVRFQDWGLFKGNIGKVVTSLSQEEVLSALKGKEVTFTQFKPNDLPWIESQKPNSTSVLLFKKIRSSRMKTLKSIRTEAEVSGDFRGISFS